MDSSRWLALCYDRIAQSYLDRKQLDKALEFYRKGEKVRRAVAERDPKDAQSQRDLAFSFGKLAYVLMETGQMEEAMGFCQQGHEIYQLLLEADSNEDPKSIAWHTHQLAECYDRIAESHFEKKQFDKAMEFYEKGATLRKSSVDRNPKDITSLRWLAWCFGRQGVVLMEVGNTKEAIDFFEQGLDIYQKLSDSDPSNTADRESLTWYTD